MVLPLGAVANASISGVPGAGDPQLTTPGIGRADGDGYDDVVIGAITFSGVATDMGQASIFFGEAGGLPMTPDWQSSGDFLPYAWFGGAVSPSGDVDGNGVPEVLVGAPGGDRAYVFCVGR